MISEGVTHFAYTAERPVHHYWSHRVIVSKVSLVCRRRFAIRIAASRCVIAGRLRIGSGVCSAWHGGWGGIPAGPNRSNDTCGVSAKSQSPNLAIVADTPRVGLSKHRGLRKRGHTSRPSVPSRYRGCARLNNCRSSIAWWRAVLTVVRGNIQVRGNPRVSRIVALKKGIRVPLCCISSRLVFHFNLKSRRQNQDRVTRSPGWNVRR